MTTRTPFEIDEWYHCYSRGVDKRRVFENTVDYDRFLLQVYAANRSHPVHISNLKEKRFSQVIAREMLEHGEPIVEIGAYCLLPNHFHILLKETEEGGIALFMQKLITGYTMYFNKKRERTGALFSGTYRSKHVLDDQYLKHLISYVHLNPVELCEPKWKEGRGNIKTIEKFLQTYPYSSLVPYKDKSHPGRQLLGEGIFELFDELPNLKEMLIEAKNYYEEHEHNGKV